MSDHRRLQRTLFRMQADAEFARALLAGEELAVASTGLTRDDLELLDELELAAVTADPEGRRRTQVLGNTASEFLLGLAAARRVPDLFDAFPASPEFHRAVAADGRLPLAFATYACRRADETGDRGLAAVIGLEEAMACLRREATAGRAGVRAERGRPSRAPTRHGDRAAREAVADASPTLVLAPTTRLHEAPQGTLDWADALQRALDGGDEPPPSPPDLGAGGGETILLHAPHPRRHGLSDVRAERLEPPVDELLRRARTPLPAEERTRFARAHGASPEDLEAFLADLVREGVLVPGA